MSADAELERQIETLQAFVRRELDRHAEAIRRNRVLSGVVLIGFCLVNFVEGAVLLLASGSLPVSYHQVMAAVYLIGLAATLALYYGPNSADLAEHLSATRDLNDTLRLLDRLALADPSLASLTPEVITDRVRRSLERAIGLPRDLSVRVPELRLPDRPLVQA